MVNTFYEILRVVFFGVFCYLILAMILFPLSILPDEIFQDKLILILIKQSGYLISGFFIIAFSKRNSFFLTIRIKIFKSIIVYILTCLAVIFLCCIIYLFNIVALDLNKFPEKNALIRFLIYCFVPTFFIGFGEEFIFRWFLFSKLKTIMKVFPAILVSSIIFCLGHNWNLPNMLSAFTIGCFLAIIYHLTNSIFYVVSIHSAWNFGQRFFFTGMSEFPYDDGRLVLLEIKNLQFYNWVEFGFCFLALVFLVIVFLKLKSKNDTEIPNIQSHHSNLLTMTTQ